jgi:hypothetical protein
MDPDWFSAVVEEYRSLRAEAVTARDAQLSILRLALPLLAALVGVGVSLNSSDEQDALLAGVLLSIVVPVIVALIFELWLGQVQRSIRAGNVVAAIEQRLSDHFAGKSEDLPPPMGWEQWLRRRDNPPWRRGLSQQQLESTVSALVIFGFLFIATVGSFFLGLSFLEDRRDQTAIHVAIATALGTVGYLIVRTRVAITGLERRETVPPVDEIWPRGGLSDPQNAK